MHEDHTFAGMVFRAVVKRTVEDFTTLAAAGAVGAAVRRSTQARPPRRWRLRRAKVKAARKANLQRIARGG